jgi:predicted Zn-dependent protease
MASWAAACGGGGKGAERAKESDVEPARLVATTVAAAAGRDQKVTVRIYVDPMYRRENRNSEASVKRQVTEAFELLRPTIGAALAGVEVRSWQREGVGSLEGALSELEFVDTAEDVDWVIGFVGAAKNVASDIHELGHARAPGRHLVVRGLDAPAEAQLLRQVVSGLGDRERAALLARRRRHKELVALLHSIAHTLGAMHVTDTARIMAPGYEAEQTSFEAENAALMAATAAARFQVRHGGGKPADEWRAMLSHIRQHPFDGWNEDERSALVGDLEVRLKTEEEGTAGIALGARLRPADRDRFRAAERMADAGKPIDAWTELEPLVDFYPDEPGVQRLACRLSVAGGRDRAAIEARCARAGELAADDPEPFVRLAQAHQAGGDRGKALAAAAEAERRLGRAAGGAAGKVGGELAAMYRTMGLASFAERVAPADAADVRGWARRTRARYGMRGVAPEREADYVEAIRALLQLVYAHKFPEAEKRAAALRKQFGDSAGVEGALCDLEIRRKKYPAARARCQKALARDDGAAWAHYLTGLLDKRDKKPDAALAHLERAIALDGELEHAYQVAVEMYGAAGRTGDAARVRKAFKTQFSRDLP